MHLLTFRRVLMSWVLFLPLSGATQAVTQGSGFVLSCGSQVAIEAGPSGVSAVSLNSNTTIWEAIPDKIVDVGPVAAGEAVAVITDTFSVIYAFSRATGALLWKTERPSSLLTSDGKYFYIIRSGYWDIEALDPASGKVLWSVQIPKNVRQGRWLQSIGSQNYRYFEHRSDQGAQNAKTAAANIAQHGPTNRATAFIVTDGREPTIIEEQNLGNVHRVARVGNVFLYEPGPAPSAVSSRPAKTPQRRSLRSQREATGTGYPSLLVAHGGLLFTAEVVVNVGKRKIVRAWPRGTYVSSVTAAENGEIVIGDSSGRIAIYDRSLRRLRTAGAPGGAVVQAATAGGNILAAAYDDGDASRSGTVTFLPEEGQPWRTAWSSDILLAHTPFAIAGNDVLMIEPGTIRGNLRLTSRHLSNGQLNWTTEDGFFYGPSVLCGETVYVRERDMIRSFDVRTGTEPTTPKLF